MLNNINMKISQRHDALSNFEKSNPRLIDGELVACELSDGTIRFKLGNGTASFNELEFVDEIQISSRRATIGTDSYASLAGSLAFGTHVSALCGLSHAGGYRALANH